MSDLLIPAVFAVLTVMFGLDLQRTLRARIVQDSGFAVDREFDPKRAKFLIALKVVWLVLCLAGFVGSLFQANR